MLKSEQTSKELTLPWRIREGRPLEMLLAVLCAFSKQGKEEVSFSEFHESIAAFQQQCPFLGYSFAGRFKSSPDLLSDLEDLKYRGYIRDYHYRLDALLPKRFLALTTLGRGQGNRIFQSLSDDIVAPLASAIEIAVKNYEARWRLWAR